MRRKLSAGTGAVRLLAAIAVALLTAARALPAQDGSGGVNRPEHVGKPYVVLVSIDGLKPEYLDEFKLPQLARVANRGARARAMVPVFPTLTFPNHYSLVTGLRPARHGIVGNSFWDPKRNQKYSMYENETVRDGTWYGGEPIWVTAERQGMVAACFFWPGSEAAIGGIRPSLYRPYVHETPNAERVATVLEWLHLPAERRPHMITLYFSALDSAQHEGSLAAPAVAKAARDLDAAIGTLLDGIDALPFHDRVNLLVTSDHGMAETTPGNAITIESLTDLSGVVATFTGPVASLHVSAPARAIEIRDTVNARLRHGRAYLRNDVPERFAYRDNPRIGDVVIIMELPWTIEREGGKPRPPHRGEHGWDNALPQMQATFLAVGPEIPKGLRIGDVQNIDVYPFMTELLGLRPGESIDGRQGLIRQLISR